MPKCGAKQSFPDREAVCVFEVGHPGNHKGSGTAWLAEPEPEPETVEAEEAPKPKRRRGRPPKKKPAE